MGFFTRESHTHFNRDEQGNVISVERSGAESSGDYLIQKHKAEHPSRWSKFKTNMKQKAADAYAQGKTERQVYREAYKEARLKRIRHSGEAAGFGIPSPTYVKPGKPRYAKLNIDTGSNLLGYPIPNYDTYRSHKKKTKTGGGKHYVVVGGKAYEKAGSGKKKHRGKKKGRGGNTYLGGIPNYMNMKPW